MRVRETIHVATLGIEPGANGAEYETVGRTDDTVYRSTVTMKVGAATSGKTWRRLIPDQMQCFSWRRGGRMRFYDARWARPGHGKRYRQFTDRTTELVQGYFRPTPRLQEALLEHTGKANVAQVIRSEYPLAADLPAGRGMTQLLALPSIQDYTRAFYGPKYYRKDLVRGIATRGWIGVGGNQYLMMTKGFAPLIPTDWIAKDLLDLEEPTFNALANGVSEVMNDYRDYRRLLRTASPKQVRMLWRDNANQRRPDPWLVSDVFRSWDQIRQFDPSYRLDGIVFSDWKSLHDVLAEDRRRIRERNVVIEHSEEWKSLEGQYGEYAVLLPKDTHELISWGGQMANCIGGYTHDAIHNWTYLYAVLKDGKMICNMEIRPSQQKGVVPELRQMVGKHNSILAKEDHDAIYAIVNSQFQQPAEHYYVGQVGGGVDLADWERELLQAARAPQPRERRVVGF